MLARALMRQNEDMHVIAVGDDTNTTYFTRVDVSTLERAVDPNEYGEPDELLLQLPHRDVVLDYFKSRKDSTLTLGSGDTPLMNGDNLKTAELSSLYIAKLSQSCCDRLAELAAQGYAVSFARVRFVVAWKDAEDEEETAIALTDLYLRRGE